jgi:hypothetical protein
MKDEFYFSDTISKDLDDFYQYRMFLCVIHRTSSEIFKIFSFSDEEIKFSSSLKEAEELLIFFVIVTIF